MTTVTGIPLTVEQRERLAEYLVLRRYHNIRYTKYGDMAYARRGRELLRRADALIDMGVQLVRGPGHTLDFPTLGQEELAAAFDRVGRPRAERVLKDTWRLRTKYTQATLATWVQLAREVDSAWRPSLDVKR